MLTLAVAQFFIGHGPVWRRGINWDYSILYSYASIPILVALALALKRRLAWVPWLLHSIEIGCVKFGVTAGFLLALLIIRGGPGFDGGTKGASPTEVVSPSRPTAKSVTSVHIRARDANGGTVNGTIRGQDGQPLPGALAYIANEVPGASTEVPVEPLLIKIGGDGFTPSVSVGYRGQPLRLFSVDQRLHTTRATWPDHGWEFNVAVPPSGPVPVQWRHTGLAQLHCTVHDRKEPDGHVLLSPHPFFSETAADGSFEIPGVPEGDYTLAAFMPRYAAHATSVRVEKSGTQILSIQLKRRE